mmetsp:Transcript_55588/g.110479  ORF Transcript_55588/g.110479 Transcript_55588/m.110479 type:complete len:91 (-) Transcript_55588:21-293(-)
MTNSGPLKTSAAAMQVGLVGGAPRRPLEVATTQTTNQGTLDNSNNNNVGLTGSNHLGDGFRCSMCIGIAHAQEHVGQNHMGAGSISSCDP